LPKAVDDYREALERLSGTGIPIGWNEAQLATLGLLGKPAVDSVRKHPGLLLSSPYHHSAQLLMLLAGWLITALAASLGAPFWFDLLGRFINVRNAGKVPGRAGAPSLLARRT
jgi:hypothetical protein